MSKLPKIPWIAQTWNHRIYLQKQINMFLFDIPYNSFFYIKKRSKRPWAICNAWFNISLGCHQLNTASECYVYFLSTLPSLKELSTIRSLDNLDCLVSPLEAPPRHRNNDFSHCSGTLGRGTGIQVCLLLHHTCCVSDGKLHYCEWLKAWLHILQTLHKSAARGLESMFAECEEALDTCKQPFISRHCYQSVCA